MQCTAQSKRTGQQCRRAAMIGKMVCLMHGGKSLAGIASPTYKHGRYSTVLPTRLLDRYRAAERDPALLALTAEIALVDARLVDVLGRVDTGESGALWAQLGAQWAEVQTARQSGNTPDLLLALVAVGDLITQGQADVAAWAEVLALVQQRRRLVESERKHLIEQQQMVRLDQVLALLTAMALAVKAHVNDPATLTAVSAEYARLTAGLGGAGAVVDAAARPADV